MQKSLNRDKHPKAPFWRGFWWEQKSEASKTVYGLVKACKLESPLLLWLHFNHLINFKDRHPLIYSILISQRAKKTLVSSLLLKKSIELLSRHTWISRQYWTKLQNIGWIQTASNSFKTKSSFSIEPSCLTGYRKFVARSASDGRHIT